MKSENVNRWLTLGANLGVLIGILLLLIELDQNANIMRGQTRNALAVELIDLMSQVANNPQLANLILRGENGEDLTPLEERQLEHRHIALFRYFENVHYQYRQGLYDEEEYSTQREAWRSVNRSPAAIYFWCNYRSTVSPKFRAEMNSLIDTKTCPTQEMN